MAEQPTGTVTLLFTDIEGSTALLQRLGTDRYAAALGLHRRLLREAFERHGGYEVDYEGDSFFVAFSRAGDAVGAAAEAQQALERAEWPEGLPVRVRMGLHAGEPMASPPKYVGLDVHKAARVMAAAHGGQVLLSEAVRKALPAPVALRDLGVHRLKDLLQPEPLHQLLIEGMRSEFPALKTLGNRPNNLPVVGTPFVGRGRELAQVAELLARDELRLLTLTGPGGIGKTRLALQTAADALDRSRDGVYWVPFAPVRDGELVPGTLAQTLGLREQAGESIVDKLCGYLADKQLLLVLDNLEHVLAAVRDLVAVVLRTAPEVRVIATSREGLRISGEQLYDVPPLTVPDPSGEAAAQSDAVDLFDVRARAADSGFELTSANRATVVEIVRRLDGLPLAIELAAARARALPPAALLERLDDRLQLLTTGAHDSDERQQTLRATIEWSYDLLPREEQKLFARLGVFAGGCRLDAAQAVCDPGRTLAIDVLDGISSLLDKSLLRRRDDPDGHPRYWMLETIREFAGDCVEDTVERQAIRDRFVWHIVNTVEDARRDLRGHRQAEAYRALDHEYPNIRAALRAAEASGKLDDPLCRMVAAGWRYWYMRGLAREGRRWIDVALGRSEAQPLRVQASILIGSVAIAATQGDYKGALENADRAIAICRELDDPVLLSGLLRDRAAVSSALGRDDDVDRDLADARREALRSGDDLTIAGATLANADHCVRRRRFESATPLLAEALATFQRLSDTEGVAWTLLSAGHAHLLEAKTERAADLYRQCVDLAERRGFFEIEVCAITGLAAVLLQRGETESSGVLAAAAAAASRERGITLSPLDNEVAAIVRGLVSGGPGVEWSVARGVAKAATAPSPPFANSDVHRHALADGQASG